ncbi:MAG: hypothetical protein ACO3UU_03265 [Minisyncoccia bacterium]
MTYKRIGIRRDRNLGDLQDKGLSLNNLLDTLVDGTSSTFISEDLDAIRNIFAYNLSSDGYREIIGSRVQFTNNDGVNIDFLPRITYQNRLDKLKIFSGVPRINGGNGLTAKYYNPDQVFENTTAVFSGTPIKQDNFWEEGQFNYSGKIIPETVNVNGGVEWSGYFIPTISGSHRFEVRTSALMTFEFETEGYTSGIGTYTEHSRIGLTATFVGSGDVGNAITLATPSNTKFIGIGQSVSNPNIVVGTLVEGYDTSTGVITLTPPSGSVNAITSKIDIEDIVFSKAIGQETRISYTTYALEKQRPYHIRLRYYIPSSFDAIAVTRYFLVNIRRPGSGFDDDLRYNYLYASDYDFSQSAKGDFNIFLDNSVLAGGGTLGNPASSAGYVKIKSTKKIDIKYAPKTSLAGITKATVSGTTTNGTKIISITDTSGIELGNFIFGTGIPENTVVVDIAINTFIITSTASTASGSTTLTFIDHRGFVKRGVGSISGTTLTLSSENTTNLKSKMVVIGNGVTQYTGITTTGSASAVTVSPSQTVGAGTPLYFYQSRGLIDEGLAAFCVPAVTRCMFTSSSIPSGTTTINVVDTTGVANGMRVLGAQFASGTTVSSFTSTQIVISTATIAAIASGGNFTVTSTPEEEGDRSLCCPPTDTSPPFSPTENGLDTTVGFPNLKINGGNIKFDSLTATVSEGNITNIASNDASTKRLPIQTASGLFNILCA